MRGQQINRVSGKVLIVLSLLALLTVLSGYFQPRQELWQEPLYRNVWTLVREFGDAELAGLVADGDTLPASGTYVVGRTLVTQH